jgi:hypothetical protein
MENDDTEIEVKESRKELLTKAWDEAEKDESEPSGHGTPAKDLAAPDVGAGDKSVPTKPAEVADKTLKAEQDKKEGAAAGALERKPGDKPVPVADPNAERAPNSWKPATREHWAAVHPEVKAEIVRREKEIQVTLSQTAQVRKFAQDFAQTVNPYSHLIRAQNSTPLQAVNNLMATAAGLMQGSAEQKAKIVSEIISNYGIDIQVLDKVLSSGGYNPAGAQPQQPVPQWAQPLFGFMDNVQKMQQQRQVQMQQEADEAITALEQKPFFDDVREDMADLMETAANRGRLLTPEQAYERAIALNPEIKKIIDQRELAAKNRNPVSEAAATLARARKAASSVKGAPVGAKAGGPAGKQTRRQQLLEAWNDAEG